MNQKSKDNSVLVEISFETEERLKKSMQGQEKTIEEKILQLLENCQL